MKLHNLRKAFTLIELIIVLAIIGVLIVALLPVVTGAPGRARDAQRKVALNNIAAALESFSSDRGKLPGDSPPRTYCLVLATLNTAASGEGTALASYLKGGIPDDPQTRDSGCDDGTTDGPYYYRSLTGGGYLLGASVENLSQANYCGMLSTSSPATTATRSDAEALILATPPTTCDATAYFLAIGG